MKFPFLAVCPLLSISLLACLLTGCGGGGASPDPDASGAAIVDNSLSRSDFRDTDEDRYYDVYVCDVKQSGVASVEMRSVDVDSSILIYRKDSGGDFDLIAQNDDLSADNFDSLIEFDVSRGKSYRIIATSSRSDERGDYTLYFSQNLGRPARVLPDVNRTAQKLGAPGVKLPPIDRKKAASQP